MTLPGGVSVLALVAVFIIGTGVILHIIGLATPLWVTVNKESVYGIWKICLGYDRTAEEKCFDYNSQQYPPEFLNSIKVCEAFAILGMLASFLGLAMAAISVLLPMIGKPKNAMFPVISLAACAASFVFILIAIVVWCAKILAGYFTSFTIGYSFFLSILGGILIGVGGILVLVSNRRVS